MRRIVKKYVIPHKGNDFRPHLLRAGGLFLVFLFVLGSFFASNVYRVLLQTSDFVASVMPLVLIDLANVERRAYELPGLTFSPLLQETARLKAEDMATKGYFAHDSPEGVSPWDWFETTHYEFSYAGENLAINFDDSSAVNAAWMNSPAHRANILNDHFTEVGIATARGMYEGKETLFVVEMFGSPAPIQPTLAARATRVEETEPAPIVVVASSSVLGKEAESQLFVSAQSANVLGEKEAVAVDTLPPVPRYASFAARWLTSPTKLLSLVYLIIITVLFVALLAVLRVRHKKRAHHLLYLIILFLIIGGTYYAYKISLQSKINLEPISIMR